MALCRFSVSNGEYPPTSSTSLLNSLRHREAVRVSGTFSQDDSISLRSCEGVKCTKISFAYFFIRYLLIYICNKTDFRPFTSSPRYAIWTAKMHLDNRTAGRAGRKRVGRAEAQNEKEEYTVRHNMATLRAFIARANDWSKYTEACRYIRGLKGRTGIERDGLEIELERQYEFLRSQKEGA